MVTHCMYDIVHNCADIEIPIRLRISYVEEELILLRRYYFFICTVIKIFQ